MPATRTGLKPSVVNATLIASSPTKDRLTELVRKYYCNPSVLILHPDGRIETTSGVRETRWEMRCARYRFIRPAEPLNPASSPSSQ